MFRGINPITLDTKGRMTVPTRYRDAFCDLKQFDWVITIDTEETCLLMYPLQEWHRIEEGLQGLPAFHPSARRIQRLLMGHATDVAMDSSGRLLLPQPLRQYATLEKHLLLIGQGNKFEIWDETAWNNRRTEWLAIDTDLENDLPEQLKEFRL
jgi:MraZ protein